MSGNGQVIIVGGVAVPNPVPGITNPPPPAVAGNQPPAAQSLIAGSGPTISQPPALAAPSPVAGTPAGTLPPKVADAVVPTLPGDPGSSRALQEALHTVECPDLVFHTPDPPKVTYSKPQNCWRELSGHVSHKEDLIQFGHNGASILLRGEPWQQVPVGTPARLGNPDLEFHEWRVGNQLEASRITHGRPSVLGALDMSVSSDLFNTTGPVDGRAVMSKLTGQQIARRLPADTALKFECYDNQALYGHLYILAKQRWVYETYGANGVNPPMSAAAPGANTWGFINIGQDMDQAQPQNIQAQHINEASFNISNAQQAGALWFDFEDYNVEEYKFLNCLFTGVGLDHAAQLPVGYPTTQCLGMPHINMRWYNLGPWYDVAVNLPTVAPIAPWSSQEILALAFKVACRRNEQGALVRGFTRAATLCHGQVRGSVRVAAQIACQYQMFLNANLGLTGECWPTPRASGLTEELMRIVQTEPYIKMFDDEYTALNTLCSGGATLFWRASALFAGIWSVLGVSTTMHRYNIDAQSQTSMCTRANHISNDCNRFTYQMGQIFETGLGGVCEFISEACSHISACTDITVHPQSMHNPKGQWSVYKDVPLGNENHTQYFSAWAGHFSYIMYMASPLVFLDCLTAYHAMWGFYTPNTKVHGLSQQLLHVGPQNQTVHKWSGMNLQVWKDRIRSEERHVFEPEGVLTANYLLQASDANFGANGVAIGRDCFHHTQGDHPFPSRLMAPVNRPVDTFKWMRPGSMPSFDWTTEEVHIPTIDGAAIGQAHFRMMRNAIRSGVAYQGVPLDCTDI